MRGSWLAAAVLLTACVTRVVGTTSSFPGRADWRDCARERLTGLGWSVRADSGEVLAARRGARLRVMADSALNLRVALEGDARADVDSLVVYCGGAG